MSYLGQQLGQGQAERFVFTASGGETSVTTSDDGRAIAYTVGQVDVYLNGAKLINGSDFTATTGTSITGLAALTASDVVEVFALSIFQASDTVSAASGGTFNGNVTVDANLSVTGTVDINGGNIDGTVIGAATPAAGSFTTGQFGTSLNVDGTVTADGLTVDGNVVFNTDQVNISDNIPKLVFTDTDTATIASITGNSSNLVYDTASSARDHTFSQAGSVRLEINSTGIDVTGTVTANGGVIKNASGATLNINTALGSADSKILLHEGSTESPVNGASIRYDGANNLFKIGVGTSVDTTRLSIDRNTGDISFYEDTGTTPKFFWDASAERLGIGTTSPYGRFTVKASGNNYFDGVVIEDTDSSTRTAITHVNGDTYFSNDPAGGRDDLVIDSSGNVGIGNTPAAWGTSGTILKAMALGDNSNFIAGGQGFAGAFVGANCYYNGTNWVYATTNGANHYNPSATGHRWYTAGSGTAGTTVSFTQAMTLDTSGNLLVGGTVDHGGRLSLTAGSSQHGTVIASNGSITGGAESGGMAEGVVDVDTTSLGTVLSIPITSQPSRWRRFVIQFMFSSGEYNLNSNSKSGTATVSFASLTSLTTLSLLDSTGNVASVSASGTTLQINFTSGFTSGTSNWEGVHVYYKILSATPSYIQMWNATLN